MAIRQERARREATAQEGGWRAEKARCSTDILHWFDAWAWTYDPRLIGKPGGAFMQFRLWPKQREMVTWLKGRIDRSAEGLIEKSRDVGASYICAAVSLWCWLYQPGFKATFGSLSVDDVDKKDNPDSIFEKLRIMLHRLPAELLPEGFSRGQHDNYMRIVNPENGSTITGEGGQNMGRGGRSTVYFLDEAARIPNADQVEKALSGNTECVVWVSSVNGMGNLFARKRHSILKPEQIFRLHWRDDPRKTEEWAEAKKASFSDPTTWASEFDIDYTASVEGVCIPAAWVESAKRLVLRDPSVVASAHAVLGGDVGAGKAKSVSIVKAGPIVYPPLSRAEPDTTDTAMWMLDIARERSVKRLNFDAPGVGAGVSSTLMKNNRVDGLTVAPINTGLPASERRWPDGRTSEEMFGNQKAEIWWLCRTALQRTHEHVLFLDGKTGGKKHSPTDLLALPSGDADSDALCLQLSLVKWERNEKGKIVIEQKNALRRRGISSPDHADALVLTFVEPHRAPMNISAELLARSRQPGHRR